MEFSDSSDEFEEFTNRLLRIGKPIRCTVNSVPAYIANYIGVAIAEMVLYPLAQSDGPAVFAVLNPIAVKDTSQNMMETDKALHHAMRSIRLSVEHALEQERYERQLNSEKVCAYVLGFCLVQLNTLKLTYRINRKWESCIDSWRTFMKQHSIARTT